MTPLHGIACFYDVGFGARAVSRKTPIYFMYFVFLWRHDVHSKTKCGDIAISILLAANYQPLVNSLKVILECDIPSN